MERGATAKQDLEALPPSPGPFPTPGRVVSGQYDPSPPSTIPAMWFARRVRAQWFSPSAFRVPPGAGSVVQPTSPLGQWLAPPSPSSPAEGVDSYSPGAWRLGAVPGAACAPGPTPSCGGSGFPLRQVRERLKGLGPRGPVRTAPPARTLLPGIPAVWTHFTAGCSGAT